MIDIDPVEAPDERACPLCAETIKRAAIRCRWCGADLEPADAPPQTRPPDPAPDPAPAPTSAPTSAPEPAAEPEPADRQGGARTDWPRVALAVLLAVGVMAAGFVLVRMLTDDRASGPPPANTAAAEQAEVVSEAARTAVLSAASQSTQRVLTYSWESLDDDIASAQAVTTGEMREQYDDTMDGIKAQTVKNEAIVEATVVSASVISVTEQDAKVLLFVNQSTVGKHLEQPRVDLNRVVVTLQRDTGDWLIAELDAL